MILEAYVKEGLPFARDLSVKNSMDSYLCFQLVLLLSVSCLFFFYQSPSSSLCTVFYTISSNIDEVLSVNPFAYVFVFGDSNVHLKRWLAYSGGSVWPVEMLPQMTLLRPYSECESYSPFLLNLFLSSDGG